MTSNFEISNLSDVAGLVKDLPRFDEDSAQAATDRQNSLTKPPGALGKLEDIAIFMAGWQKTERPKIDNAQALVFAGNHGICTQGVNPFPQEVTVQMVANFEHGGAAINQLCQANGADLSVVALDLDTPTADFTTGPAMSETECLAAMNKGAQAVDSTADILILGEMGIGNSTVAAALAAAVFNGEPADWVGRGTGSDDDGVKRKIDAISSGLKLHGDQNAMGILTSLGGREQAAICGAVLAARAYGIPVILDGYICTASVAPLHLAQSSLLDHCLVGHLSVEPGHQKLLTAMDKSAILNFDMRLGEGSGAALALGIVKSALACHNGMATFAEAQVSGG
ncbi:MAG: nicotinate-nucleotide--dimethylbenzimidazole phosphoribosyltransferase [Paracoccaceae bacterium]|nr:nicotinate-nucleotide--dimethylbenzimidazole phosphoribosyltransferase [Paracoccaceae bacterium]MDG2259682.1 nicotinate-nucleotide--dimethylbenzimidazole phosphoribosyltransferase [Paracoccaceae bacterium]